MNSTSPGGTSLLKALARRLLARRTKILIASTTILAFAGAVAALTERYDLAFVAILLLQAATCAYLVTERRQRGTTEQAVQAHIDRASARTLGDLARARRAILDAVETLSPRDRR